GMVELARREGSSREAAPEDRTRGVLPGRSTRREASPPFRNLPQESLRRQSRRSNANHSRVALRATHPTGYTTAWGDALRARASPAQPNPGGGFGGGRRGPLR